LILVLFGELAELGKINDQDWQRPEYWLGAQYRGKECAKRKNMRSRVKLRIRAPTIKENKLVI
jgi:hypothetical protein